MSRTLTACASVLVVCVLSSACGGDSEPSDSVAAPSNTSPVDETPEVPETSSTSPVTTPPPSEQVIDEAADFLAAEIPRMDAASLMILDFVGRNWGLPALAPAQPAAMARLEDPSIESEELALGRLADPGRPDPEAELSEPTSVVLAAALHCDQVPFEPADRERLVALVEGGEYDTTHAALALGWMTELGCELSGLDTLRTEVIEAMATELSAAVEVTDLAVEQSAMLHYLGAGDRVGEDWSDRVTMARNPDGGWGARASNWHMAMLALWTLVADGGPGSGLPLLRAAA